MQKQNKNELLDFYYIDAKYADFMRDKSLGDARVPYTVYPKREKFFIGVVFKIGDFNYFAPVSSNKEMNPAAISIIDGNESLGSVRINFMFPVIDGVYKQFIIANIKDRKYKRLVEKQYRFCNKFREQIRGLAQVIYEKRIHGQIKIDKIYIMDFKKLEKRALSYKKTKQ